MRKILISLMLTVAPFTCAQAKSCLNEKDDMGFKWARGPVRKQGGGWIWYLGKFESPNESYSMDMAESQAAYRLMQECEKVPKNSKLIERCTQKSRRNSYISYARISTKQDECKKPDVHKILSQKPKEYQKLINSYRQKIEHQNTIASKKRYKFLVSEIKLLKETLSKIEDNNSLDVVSYVPIIYPKEIKTKKCVRGHGENCYVKARALINTKPEDKRIFELLKTGCAYANVISCIMYLYEIETFNQKADPLTVSVAISMLNEMCNHGIKTRDPVNNYEYDPCNQLGAWFLHKRSKKSLFYYRKACDSGYSTGCSNLKYAKKKLL